MCSNVGSASVYVHNICLFPSFVPSGKIPEVCVCVCVRVSVCICMFMRQECPCCVFAAKKMMGPDPPQHPSPVCLCLIFRDWLTSLANLRVLVDSSRWPSSSSSSVSRRAAQAHCKHCVKMMSGDRGAVSQPLWRPSQGYTLCQGQGALRAHRKGQHEESSGRDGNDEGSLPFPLTEVLCRWQTDCRHLAPLRKHGAQAKEQEERHTLMTHHPTISAIPTLRVTQATHKHIHTCSTHTYKDIHAYTHTQYFYRILTAHNKWPQSLLWKLIIFIS